MKVKQIGGFFFKTQKLNKYLFASSKKDYYCTN